MVLDAADGYVVVFDEEGEGGEAKDAQAPDALFEVAGAEEFVLAEEAPGTKPIPDNL